MNMTGTWKEVAAVLVLSAVLGTVSNLVAADARKLKWFGDMPLAAVPAPVSPVAAASPAEDGSVTAAAASVQEVEIDTATAYADWSSGALFLDARVSESYYEGRIAGARNFAVWEGDIDGKIVSLMAETAPDARVVTYCTGGKCEDSHLLRGKLLAAGFTNVAVFKDGFPAWQQAGHPEEK